LAGLDPAVHVFFLAIEKRRGPKDQVRGRG
jgi:hypothetical protein